MTRIILLVTVALNIWALLQSPTFAHTLPDVSSIIEKAAPAVVQVNVYAKTNQNSGIPPVEIPSHLKHLFEPQSAESKGRELLAQGSGFLVSANGHILTSFHVLKNDGEVEVVLENQHRYTAQYIGVDIPSDLALLKIERTKMPYLTFAPIHSEKRGQWMLAMGSPYGLGSSASIGIVSATGRSILSANKADLVGYIQTDAAINPGHSGGPLLNLKGQVQGVNAQIFTDQSSSIGLSFAVPSSVASTVVKQLIEQGNVQHSDLGVSAADIEHIPDHTLDTPTGALITHIPEKTITPLRPGDIILRVNGQDIKTASALKHAIAYRQPTEKIKLRVWREGKTVTISTTLVVQALTEP